MLDLLSRKHGQVTIHSPPDNRERILAFGLAGTGKSKCYIDIFDATTEHFYILDTDVAVRRMFASRDQSRITFIEATDYQSAAEGFIRMGRQASEGEWMVVDLLSPTWQWCQDYWLAKTQKGATQENMSMWVPTKEVDYDWQRINSMYNNFMSNIMRSPAHIFCTAEEQAIMHGKWEGDLDREYEEFGAKPAGNKRNSHLFHEVLYCRKKQLKVPKYLMTATKEREGRECDWNDLDFTDLNFADEYLVGVGGWVEDEETEPTPRRRRRRQ